MAKKTIEDIQVSGKKVLVRCDFNVPLDENKLITDENRIRGALPTIKYLMDRGARVILCSHLGRPKGGFDMKYSLKPVADRLSQLLGKEVNRPLRSGAGLRACGRRRDAAGERPLPQGRGGQ